jgi:hypothetical protein
MAGRRERNGIKGRMGKWTFTIPCGGTSTNFQTNDVKTQAEQRPRKLRGATAVAGYRKHKLTRILLLADRIELNSLV